MTRNVPGQRDPLNGLHRLNIEERSRQPHYVYRCYDSDGALLYVGCTYRPEVRMTWHRSLPMNRVWTDRVAKVRFIVWPNRPKALEMEKLAIQTEAPLFNKRLRKGAVA